ncbi:hypothetical protein BVC80_3737g1 [Macleaya cordata]|uniref:Uncharacterized protein n=1 Tax=Macleaya cordata TaxID=56857 RepID=A0A200PZQ1_MACCD|nr:hypothetical protein BVC80_3737g1 [Macleaya cordata]
MAYRRSISTRVILLSQRLHPSFRYILHNDDRNCQNSPADSSRPTSNNFLPPNSNLRSVFSGSGALFRGGRSSSFSCLPGLGSSFRSFSSCAIGGGSDKLQYMGDVAEVLTQKSFETAGYLSPVVSEVAIAAADSFYPVAVFQHLVGGIPPYFGFNW